MHILFRIKAPSDFVFEGITGSSVVVKLDEPKENNVIKRFEAFVKGGTPQQTCTIQALADPLKCTITGLSSSRAYTVGVKACVPGDNGCGPALEKPFRTG